MRTRESNIRNRLRSLLALALSVLYLFGPIRHATGEALHTISHWVDSRHHYSLRNNTGNPVHHHTFSDHKQNLEVHPHDAIVWVDQFLEGASHSSGNEKTPLEEANTDKHLFSVTLFICHPIDNASQKSPDIITPDATGHLGRCFHPPRVA